MAKTTDRLGWCRVDGVVRARAHGQVLGLGIIAAVLAAFMTVLVSGFVEGRHDAELDAEREAAIKPPLRVTRRQHEEPLVSLDIAAQSAVGLESANTKPAKYQDHVRAYGTVLDLAALTTLNTNYVAAVSQLEATQARLAASEPAFERARALYSKSIGSLVQVQTTEAALASERAAVAAAQSLVRTLRATALQEWGPVIGDSMFNDGGLIKRLIERKEFLLQITLPPGVDIDPPPNASAEFVGSARRTIVRYISPATRSDARIQGVSYFYAAGGNSGLLPGMNVRASVPNGDLVDGIVVPNSAVVWWAGRAWAYQKKSAATFSRREIATTMPDEKGSGFVVPVDHFAGDPIVTVGAQVLLSEEFRSQIQVDGDD